jgi:arylsulfatase A-like enzyme
MVVSDHGFEAAVSMGVLTGNHKSLKAIDGVIFARGPGIPAGAPAGPMTINDVTPTILTWLGLPIAEDMDGQPAGFLDVPEVKTIPTYDVAPVERLDLTPSGVEETIVEQLRGLGYFE